MGAGVSFLGLNTSFDSANLIAQLVQVETQSRVFPLQIKKAELENENQYLDAISGKVSSVKSTINWDNHIDGSVSLAPKNVTSSDTTNEFLEVTATDDAVPQTFDVNISKLATNTIRKSDTSIATTLTNASANTAAHFKDEVTLSDGTVTINGVTQTFSNATGTIADIETFLSSFAGVTATFNTATGKFDLTGLTSLGSSGDTSNMLFALGLDSAQIVAGNATGIQNLEAAKSGSTLTSLGVTGTKITINGTDVDYTPGTDTIKSLVESINNTAGTKVNAAYDGINGEIILTGTETGALSITVSSDGDITPLNLTNAGSETLGDNAEFTISTLNGGATLTSNDNEVTGLIEGVTLDLNKVTTSAVTVTIAEDPSGYKEKITSILGEVNSLLNDLDNRNDSFSRSMISRIKNTLTKIVGVNGTDTYTSFIELGLKSDLDGEGNFTGYSLDATLFDAAFENAPDDMNKTLWGSDDTDSVFALMSNSDKGIITQLQELLDVYVHPTVSANGLINQVQESISNQIKTTDNSIERAEDSIASMEARLRRQFAQLDVINAQFQQQQAAVAGLGGG